MKRPGTLEWQNILDGQRAFSGKQRDEKNKVFVLGTNPKSSLHSQGGLSPES